MITSLPINTGSIKDAIGLFSHSFIEDHPLDFHVKNNRCLIATANFKLDMESDWKHITFVFPGNGSVEITAPDIDNIIFTGIYPVDGTDTCRDRISQKVKSIHGINLNFKGR